MSVFRVLRDKKGTVYIEPFLAVVLGLVAIFILYLWFLGKDRPIEKAAQSYLQALATGDLAAAREVSEGRAAEAAGKLEGKNLAARVDEIFTSVQALGRGWARVKATVELTLADGTADVGWYELDLVREGGIWKVYSFKETAPCIEGHHIARPGKGDMDEVEAVLKGYLDDLAAGRYKEAARWLAGPVLREYLATGDVLSKGKLLEAIDEVSLTPLARDGKLLVSRCDYHAGEKKIGVAAVFYRTAQGWKIVGVKSII